MPPAEPADPLGNLLMQKKHMHELRVMGGTANVTMAELQAWFAGLWRGRALAGTIGVLTIGLTIKPSWPSYRGGSRTTTKTICIKPCA